MGTKRHFSILRPDGRTEGTIVGRTGQKHPADPTKQGKDGHFTDEGQYRRAIEQAVDENKR